MRLSLPVLIATWLLNPAFAEPGIETCGDPTLESMAWIAKDGTIESVAGRNSILVQLKSGERVVVQLAGISGKDPEFRNLIQREAIGRQAQVVLNPSISFRKRMPGKVDGRVIVAGRGDLAMLLLRASAAQYARPRPYTISRYTDCEYELAAKPPAK